MLPFLRWVKNDFSLVRCLKGVGIVLCKKINREKMKMNCTPFVRQYDILNNKWGAVHGIYCISF